MPWVLFGRLRIDQAFNFFYVHYCLAQLLEIWWFTIHMEANLYTNTCLVVNRLTVVSGVPHLTDIYSHRCICSRPSSCCLHVRNRLNLNGVYFYHSLLCLYLLPASDINSSHKCNSLSPAFSITCTASTCRKLRSS